MPYLPSAGRLGLILLLLSCFTTLNSQTVVNSTGGTLKNNSCYFEYSIGEISITTLKGERNDVTQGLLQPIFNERPAQAFISSIKKSAFNILFKNLNTDRFYNSRDVISLQNDKSFNANVVIESMIRLGKFYKPI